MHAARNAPGLYTAAQPEERGLRADSALCVGAPRFLDASHPITHYPSNAEKNGHPRSCRGPLHTAGGLIGTGGCLGCGDTPYVGLTIPAPGLPGGRRVAAQGRPPRQQTCHKLSRPQYPRRGSVGLCDAMMGTAASQWTLRGCGPLNPSDSGTAFAFGLLVVVAEGCTAVLADSICDASRTLLSGRCRAYRWLGCVGERCGPRPASTQRGPPGCGGTGRARPCAHAAVRGARISRLCSSQRPASAASWAHGI